jgi:formylglycine-generating enzyme required for sulfatase activity
MALPYEIPVAFSILLASCAPAPLAPLPEALIVVDTDAAVPSLVDRLRVDLYARDGFWFDSRDLPRRAGSDWPASFSVFGDTEDDARTVFVRLRAYHDGKVRDYRGERFMERPAPGDPAELVEPPPPPEGATPRLVKDARDATPDTEPLPNLAIDRLLRVDLTPAVRGSVRVDLRGACFGTMANLEARTTCVETENERVPVRPESLDSDMSVPPASTLVNRFAAPTACTRAPKDGELCVPGGAFMLGSADVNGLVLFDAMATIPERIAIVPPLLMDGYEVSVERWRRAKSEGFRPLDDPYANDADAPLPAEGGPAAAKFCVYSHEPLALNSREAYPVNCIAWSDARAFCQFYGGDLPTEAQWEYVASATGDDSETLYPWGNDLLPCDALVYSRELTGDFCFPDAFGPAPVGAGFGDVTPLGVHDLGGSVSEWVLDSPRAYSARCWASLGMTDPRCWEEDAERRGLRGSGWATGQAPLSSLRPTPIDDGLLSKNVGFRCVRSGVETSP